MTLDLCIKYLDFVAKEAERHIADKSITDDELMLFVVEFNHFKNNVAQSDLDGGIKKRLDEISYDHTPDVVVRRSAYGSVMKILFGRIYEYREQARREADLQRIRSQANTLSMYIKMNY